MDGPVFVKSGVTIEGDYSDDSPGWTFFRLYEGANNGNTAEDAVVVIDGVTDATASGFRPPLLLSALGCNRKFCRAARSDGFLPRYQLGCEKNVYRASYQTDSIAVCIERTIDPRRNAHQLYIRVCRSVVTPVRNAAT